MGPLIPSAVAGVTTHAPLAPFGHVLPGDGKGLHVDAALLAPQAGADQGALEVALPTRDGDHGGGVLPSSPVARAMAVLAHGWCAFAGGSERAYSRGDRPITRLKAVLKALSES